MGGARRILRTADTMIFKSKPTLDLGTALTMLQLWFRSNYGRVRKIAACCTEGWSPGERPMK